MTFRLTNLCRACKHLKSDQISCDAFPAGVPDEIIKFGADHRKPFPGDQGIVFEMKSDEQSQFAFDAWKSSRK